jgi:hypothetical protein
MDSPQSHVNLELSVRVGSDPIAGELRGHRLPARQFVGWVALVRSLEETISAAVKARNLH